MTDATPDEQPRKRGDAQWRADCEALEARNAAERKRAQDAKGSKQQAFLASERRAALVEAAQLKVLNERIAQRRSS